MPHPPSLSSPPPTAPAPQVLRLAVCYFCALDPERPHFVDACHGICLRARKGQLVDRELAISLKAIDRDRRLL